MCEEIDLNYPPSNMVAYWNKFSRPEIDPGYLYINPFFTADTWWIDKDKEAVLKTAY